MADHEIHPSGRERVANLTREEIAHIEVGHTDVTPGVARALVIAFLTIACAVPLFEMLTIASGDLQARTPWQRLAAIPSDATAVTADTAWRQIVGTNRVVLSGLHEFEDALEDESRLGRLLRPRAQQLLTGALGAGNEQAYIGRDGWLFFRPDVEYVTSRGFLRSDVHARRVRAADEWTTPPQPDPRIAVRKFRDDLAELGIALVVMPVPVKPTVHPEMLAGERSRTEAPQNPDYARFIEDIRAAGVEVFDTTAVLAHEARQSGATQYLATDTHWRPEAMELVAARLADVIRRTESLEARPDPGYRVDPAEVNHRGDVFGMLDLPADQTLYTAESVGLRRIVSPDGTPWRSSPDADVLVLGDSFANIYSLESMGWGTSAGLVEQLSYELRRPVDRLVQNDAGAYATREMLHRAGPERLAGKKIVIWQFATRELAFGDWRIY